MEISTEALKTLLGEAFDLGYQQSAEFKDDLIQELMTKVPTKSKDNTFKVYTVTELREFPEGTLFEHKTRGRCWVVLRQKEKAIQFQKGGQVVSLPEKGQIVGLISDGEPWDKPMKLLHSEKND